ncbi:MAG: antitoxin [Desulfobacteraceae bacterium IS3]|nr:MAG: antitoxin [Desulfobacteraceae bacterium IS3]
MIRINASDAQSRLYDLIDETGLSHKPLIITGKKSNAVLISEEDWESVQETLYLLSVPKMRESIREGLSTPTDECAKELDW